MPSIHCSIWGKSGNKCGNPWHTCCCGGCKLTIWFVYLLTLVGFLGWQQQWNHHIWEHLHDCSNWVQFQWVERLPLETCWECQGAIQMVGCKLSNLSKPSSYGVGLPQYTWYHYLLYLLFIQLILFFIATSTVVEHVFSQGHQLLSFICNWLHASSVCASLCMGSWGRNDLILFEDVLTGVRDGSKRKRELSDIESEVDE